MAEEAKESDSRARTVSDSSTDSGGKPAGLPRRRSFSAAEEGKRTIVIAVDASEDSKFAFEC